MSYDFNANEILKMAEQIERNGYKFYKSAAENVAKSQEKEFLLKLAEMEQHHEKLFASIRSELSQQESLRKRSISHPWKKSSRQPLSRKKIQ
jgi:rubrerythrin